MIICSHASLIQNDIHAWIKFEPRLWMGYLVIMIRIGYPKVYKKCGCLLLNGMLLLDPLFITPPLKVTTNWKVITLQDHYPIVGFHRLVFPLLRMLPCLFLFRRLAVTQIGINGLCGFWIELFFLFMCNCGCDWKLSPSVINHPSLNDWLVSRVRIWQSKYTLAT